MAAVLNVYNTVRASEGVPGKRKGEWRMQNPAASRLMGYIIGLWKERDG